MPYECPYCNIRITGLNKFIMHKRKHMGKITPIIDPLNKKISNFAAPKKNSVWTGRGVEI
jgi:hypothetical protein